MPSWCSDLSLLLPGRQTSSGFPVLPHPLSQVRGLPRNRHICTPPLPAAVDSRCSAARLPLPLAWGSHLSSPPPWSWRLFSFSSKCVKTQIRAIREKSLQGKAGATTAPDCQLRQSVVKHRLTHTDYKLEQIPKQEGAERRGSKFHFRFSCFSSNLFFAVCSSFHSHAPKRGRWGRNYFSSILYKGKLRPRGRTVVEGPIHLDWSSWL